jgi:hypothetical protein
MLASIDTAMPLRTGGGALDGLFAWPAVHVEDPKCEASPPPR